MPKDFCVCVCVCDISARLFDCFTTCARHVHRLVPPTLTLKSNTAQVSQLSFVLSVLSDF